MKSKIQENAQKSFTKSMAFGYDSVYLWSFLEQSKKSENLLQDFRLDKEDWLCYPFYNSN